MGQALQGRPLLSELGRFSDADANRCRKLWAFCGQLETFSDLNALFNRLGSRPETVPTLAGCGLMLDALKFAFEILIVGALALPWLAILSRMFGSGPTSSLPSYWSVLPKPAQGPVAVAIVIAFGYVAGSAVSRASRDLFNDELLKPLPTEDAIRDGVYQDEYCGQDLIDMDEYLPFFEKPSLSGKTPVSGKSSLSAIHQDLRKQLKKA